jgi:hypothetical protein
LFVPPVDGVVGELYPLPHAATPTSTIDASAKRKFICNLLLRQRLFKTAARHTTASMWCKYKEIQWGARAYRYANPDDFRAP